MADNVERLRALNQDLKDLMVTVARRANDQRRDIDKLTGIVAEIQYVITREFKLNP